MPVWFLLVLLVVVAVAIVLAIGMGISRRSAGGQNTTIVERRPSDDRNDVTVVDN